MGFVKNLKDRVRQAQPRPSQPTLKPKPSAPSPRPSAPERHARGANEFSTGRGLALNQFARAGRTAAANFLDALRRPVASTLRTEVPGDGSANCLEQAVRIARPGDNVVLLSDTQDGVGHAVVQRPDGTIIDPNAPDVPVRSLEVYQALNPRYADPVIVKDTDAERILNTPPGEARDALLTQLGLDGAADLRVADAGGTTAGTRPEQIAAEVAVTYANEGADAAAAQFEELTRDLSPADAAAATRAASETIDSIVSDLGSRATGDADGSQDDRDGPEAQFDTTVANLNIAMARGLPGSRSEIDRVAGLIADEVKDHGIGRWDEALGNTAVGGANFGNLRGNPGALDNADTTLAVAVVGELNSAGKTGEANDILQNIEASVDHINDVTGDLAGKVDEYNADLAVLIQEWGQFAESDEELQAMINAFKDSHPEYAQLEALAGGAIAVTDQLADVPGRFPGLSHAGGLNGQIDRATDNLPQLLETGSGNEAAQELSEDRGLLGRVVDLAAAGRKDQKYLSRIATNLVKLIVWDGVTAGSVASRQAALNRLSALAPVLGLDTDEVQHLTRRLSDVVNATDEVAAQAALERFDDHLKQMNKGVFQSGVMGQVFMGAAFVLSGVTLAGSIDAALDDPSFKNVLTAMSGTTGTLGAGASFAQSFFSNARTIAGLRNAGTYLGKASAVFGVALSTFQAGAAFREGDAAVGGLYLAQAAGGMMVMLGGTGVGLIGAGVVMGAALAIGQLQKVRASNRFEDGHTQAFLEALGVPENISYHLRNADSDGRMVGLGLVAMAQQLGVTPRELFDHLATLPPDDVLHIVETLHGVDPQDDGSFVMTAGSDDRAGTRQTGRTVQPHRAESIQGAINFLENHHGISFDALTD